MQFIEPSKPICGYRDSARWNKNRIAINMLKAQILHLLNEEIGKNHTSSRYRYRTLYLDDGIISLTLPS